MSLKSERANKDEISFLKATNVLGKRAPSCSLLSAEDTVRLLTTFGRDNIANDLAKAITTYRKENPMKDGTIRAAVVAQPVPASSRIYFNSDSQGGDSDDTPASPNGQNINRVNGSGYMMMNVPMQMQVNGLYNNNLSNLYMPNGVSSSLGFNPLLTPTQSLNNSYLQQQQQQQQQLNQQLNQQQVQALLMLQQQQQQLLSLGLSNKTIDPALLYQAQLQQQQQLLGMGLGNLTSSFTNLGITPQLGLGLGTSSTLHSSGTTSTNSTLLNSGLSNSYFGTNSSLSGSSLTQQQLLQAHVSGQNHSLDNNMAGSSGPSTLNTGSSSFLNSPHVSAMFGNSTTTSTNSNTSTSMPGSGYNSAYGSGYAANNSLNSLSNSNSTVSMAMNALSKSPLGDLSLGRPKTSVSNLSTTISALASKNNVSSQSFNKSPHMTGISLTNTSNALKPSSADIVAAAVASNMFPDSSSAMSSSSTSPSKATSLKLASLFGAVGGNGFSTSSAMNNGNYMNTLGNGALMTGDSMKPTSPSPNASSLAMGKSLMSQLLNSPSSNSALSIATPPSKPNLASSVTVEPEVSQVLSSLSMAPIATFASTPSEGSSDDYPSASHQSHQSHNTSVSYGSASQDRNVYPMSFDGNGNHSQFRNDNFSYGINSADTLGLQVSTNNSALLSTSQATPSPSYSQMQQMQQQMQNLSNEHSQLQMQNQLQTSGLTSSPSQPDLHNSSDTNTAYLLQKLQEQQQQQNMYMYALLKMQQAQNPTQSQAQNQAQAHFLMQNSNSAYSNM